MLGLAIYLLAFEPRCSLVAIYQQEESMSTEGRDKTLWAAPLTCADIPELVKAVADALSKKEVTTKSLVPQKWEVPSLEVS